MQYTSKTPPSRGDLAQLHEALDKRLVQRQANERGLCPVRSELYSQVFDELIRQVTLDLPERGLLLLRIRDESRMTIDAYKTCVWSGREGGAALFHNARAAAECGGTLRRISTGLTALSPPPSRRHTLHARLYDSSVTFGVRKQLQAEQGIPELEAEVLAVAEQKKALEAKMLSLRSKLENAERRIAAKRTLDEKRRKEELGYLKHEGKHLEAFVKNMGRS